MFTEISSWCARSGASLSLDKCNHLHIWKKWNCNCKTKINKFEIKTSKEIKILGLFINTKYKWNSYIAKLKNSLSSYKYNCHPYTLFQTVKSLCIAKIEYALPIYGKAPNSILRPIKTSINAALRSALGAFPTTPTHNLYVEANVLPLEERIKTMTAKLFHILIHPTWSNNKKITKKSNSKYRKSTIQESINICTNLGLTIDLTKKLTKSKPPWHLKLEAIDTQLAKY